MHITTDDQPSWRQRLRRLATDPQFLTGVAVGCLVFTWAAGMGYTRGYRDGLRER